MKREKRITTTSVRSTAESCWPANTPPTFRPGRRAPSCRRWTRSSGCTSAWSRHESCGAARHRAHRFGSHWRSPVAADDASPKSAAMSHGWEFGEQGGADLFRNVCAGCHQPDAKGAVGAGAYPSLVADEKLASSRLHDECPAWWAESHAAGRRHDERRASRRRRQLRPHPFRQLLLGRGFGRGRIRGKATGGIRPLIWLSRSQINNTTYNNVFHFGTCEAD